MKYHFYIPTYLFVVMGGDTPPAPPAHLYDNVDMDQLLILQK